MFRSARLRRMLDRIRRSHLYDDYRPFLTKRLLAFVPGLVTIVLSAFTTITPVNPNMRPVILWWTPGESGVCLGLLLAAVAWISFATAKSAREALIAVRKAEETRRAIAAIGVAANWDLDLERLYRRVSQDLRSIINFDRLAITAAQSNGQMKVEYVSGLADEGVPAGEFLPGASGEPDGLSQPALINYQSRITVPVAACSGTLTIRSKQPGAYTAAHADLLRQAVAQISPGIANAIHYRSSRRQVEERTALAAIGRAANSEQELHPIFQTVESSLSRLIPFDHLGMILANDEETGGMVAYWSSDGLLGHHQGDTVKIDIQSISQTDLVSGRGYDPLNLGVERSEESSEDRVWLQVPLVVREKLIGLMVLRSHDPAGISAEESALVRNVSLQVAPAIQNARMLAAERELRSTLDRQNRELQEANNARKQFLSSVSHELKTPLTIIAGFIDLLMADATGKFDAEQKETLEIIRRNANHLDVLINDLLDISRLDAGTFKLNKAAFCVNALIEDIEASFRSVVVQKSQRLTVEAPDEEVWIKADRTRISQVVTNLVSNASKYSPEDTTIEIMCDVQGERLHIAVQDRGIGIPEAEQENLFTAFFRVDNETTRKVSGTGLGLVIAKSIAELHGGEINLESEPGKGTKIEFWLPGLTSPQAAEAPGAQAFAGSRLWQGHEPDELQLGAD